MKKTLIVILAILLCGAAHGRKVKTIIVANTLDHDLHCGVKTNMAMTRSHLEEVAAILDMVDDFEPPVILQGYDCTKASLMRTLSAMEFGQDDAVLFFYFGHGARSNADTSIFPQMSLLGDDGRTMDEDHFPIDDVRRILEDKGARFVLVFGDCCNNKVENVSPKSVTLVAASNGSSEYVSSKAVRETLERLFVKSQGSVVTTGSEVGKYSYYLSCMADRPYGHYTNNFWLSIDAGRSKSLSWEDWLAAASSSTDSILRNQPENPVSQRPIYRIYNPASKPSPSAPQPPISAPPAPDFRDQDTGKASQSNAYSTEYIQELKRILMSIASDKYPFDERERAASDALRTRFAAKARVEVVAQNGTTIVQTETAADFLERISLAVGLRNVSVRGLETDASGRITYLLVHEVYEKKR